MSWIGIKKFDIKNLHVFINDFFSWLLAQDLINYKGVARPRTQAHLLMFWDEIGCPWKNSKQEFGESLKIIGFHVNINNGLLTLTDESLSNIISTVKTFLTTPGY